MSHVSHGPNFDKPKASTLNRPPKGFPISSTTTTTTTIADTNAPNTPKPHTHSHRLSESQCFIGHEAPNYAKPTSNSSQKMARTPSRSLQRDQSYQKIESSDKEIKLMPKTPSSAKVEPKTQATKLQPSDRKSSAVKIIQQPAKPKEKGNK